MTTIRKVLVIARYKEDLSWLSQVPVEFDICVYDKSESPSIVKVPSDVQRRCQINKIPNVGRETQSYLKYIIDNYDNLPETLVMCQGDPFPHAPEFLQGLSHLSQKLYQPLTIQYMPNTVHDDMAKLYKQHRFYRIERISTHTLAPLTFFDCGIPSLANSYLDFYKLPIGTNIMLHHLEEAGLTNYLSPSVEAVNFSYSAIFSVKKQAVLQHPKIIYENLCQKTCRPNWFECSIMERTWHLLFDKKSALNSADAF